MTSHSLKQDEDVRHTFTFTNHNGRPIKPSDCACDLASILGGKAVLYEFEERKLYLAVFEQYTTLNTFLFDRRKNQTPTQIPITKSTNETTAALDTPALPNSKHKPLVDSECLKEETLTSNERLRSQKPDRFNFFNIDDHRGFRYVPFHEDFGPFSLSITHRFLSWMKLFFDTAEHRTDDIVVVVTSNDDPQARLNVTYLVAIATLVLLEKNPETILQILKTFIVPRRGQTLSMQPGCRLHKINPTLIRFKDVSGATTKFHMTLGHCLNSFAKAIEHNWYSYYSFDQTEYEFCEQVQCGDSNWIVPGKLLAFSGPNSETTETELTYRHRPEFYYNYFKDYKVKIIIRLNDKEYNSSLFEKLGFEHYDLIFEDGSAPTMKICKKFISIVDSTDGAVAIHCAAGLGRTGTLIGAYMIARYGFDAATAIAWTRICRPGSVIAGQQDWLLLHSHQIATEFNNPKINQSLRKFHASSCKSKSDDTQMDVDVVRKPVNHEVSDNKVSVFSLTSSSLGQAMGLLKAKEQRETGSSYYLRKSIGDEKPSPLRPKSRIITNDEFKCNEGPIDDTDVDEDADYDDDHGNVMNSSDEATRKHVSKKIAINNKELEHIYPIIDLGKTMPFTLKYSDYDNCKFPHDVQTYTLTEAPFHYVKMNHNLCHFNTWKIKYPHNTYFHLLLMKKDLRMIKGMSEKSRNTFLVPTFYWYVGCLTRAFNDNHDDLFTGNKDRTCESVPPIAHSGGIVVFTVEDTDQNAIDDCDKD